MNKTISTRVGLITGILILSLILILVKVHLAAESPVHLLQFLLLFSGVMVSMYLLFKYYAEIRFVEAFSHGMKTVATILILVIIGNSILFFIFSTGKDMLQQLTFLIMKTLFSYGLSGTLSSIFAAYIFKTFTKK